MKTRTTRTAAALIAVAFLAAACGDDGDDSSNDTTAATEAPSTEAPSTEAPTTEAPTTEAAAEEPGTVVEVAIASGEFPTLVAAIEAAGLVDTLNGPGPLTVFAPTEEAFAAALDALGMTADELLADTETLTSVLTYHVLPGEVYAETVVTLDGEEVETVNGADVLITVDGDTVMVNSATVIATDVEASNGVIHVIDEVLLPPSDEMAEDEMSEDAAAESGTVVDVAVESGDFPTLVAAIEAAGLVETLSGPGPFTVFAPTEEAFAELLATLEVTAEELLADTETLTAVLTYHVVPLEATSELVVTLDGAEVETLNGAPVLISVDGDNVMVNDANVLAVDIEASNGVIHVIDAVLLPPA
jgi:transforming growth factor-beta-induced protein